MTEVSFYHLHSSPLDKALPKLMEKVHQAGKRSLIISEDDDKVEHLNKAMWTYTTKYFLPHGSKKDKYKHEQPIYLTTEISDNPNDASVIAVTDGRVLDFSSDSLQSFERIVDMFDGTDDTTLQQARSRWKQYKEQGITLTYWKQNSKGGWEKGA